MRGAERQEIMTRLVLTVLGVGAVLGVAACDAPTGPGDEALTQDTELVAVAYSHGLSCSPILSVHTIDFEGKRYDIGCAPCSAGCPRAS